MMVSNRRSAVLPTTISSVFIVVQTFGVLREPATKHPLALAEEFTDAPKCRSSEYAAYGREDGVLDEKGGNNSSYSNDKEEPPQPRTRIILGLDDNGVEQPYYTKCGNGDDDTCEIYYWKSFWSEIVLGV